MSARFGFSLNASNSVGRIDININNARVKLNSNALLRHQRFQDPFRGLDVVDVRQPRSRAKRNVSIMRVRLVEAPDQFGVEPWFVGVDHVRQRATGPSTIEAAVTFKDLNRGTGAKPPQSPR